MKQFEWIDLGGKVWELNLSLFSIHLSKLSLGIPSPSTGLSEVFHIKIKSLYGRGGDTVIQTSSAHSESLEEAKSIALVTLQRLLIQELSSASQLVVESMKIE